MIRDERLIINYLRDIYNWSRNQGFVNRLSKSRLPLSSVTNFPVVCQTFHTKDYTHYFLVNNGKPSSNSAPNHFTEDREKPTLSLREQVEQTLAQKLQVSKPDITSRYKTEVSPWLDLTQWERYFRDYNLSRVTCLLDLPSLYPLFDPD